MLAVQHILQLDQPRIQIFDERRRIARHGLGIQLKFGLHIHPGILGRAVPLPLRLVIRRQLMILDEGVPSVELLKLRKQPRGHVARTLQRAEEGLHGLLPGLDVLPARGGGDELGGSEARIGVDFGDDVEGFHHDEVVLGKLEDGRDFLAHEGGGRGDVVVGEEVEEVFDVFDAQGEADADAEGAVVVDVDCGEGVQDGAGGFGEGGDGGGRGGRGSGRVGGAGEEGRGRGGHGGADRGGGQGKGRGGGCEEGEGKGRELHDGGFLSVGKIVII
mmetsp:Transcript_27428/g.56906  ORF Transcript_27428/g.56906 Transcript_27428/m.56906 type:complete len:274 (-) Transcript_27428:84-905(-)